MTQMRIRLEAEAVLGVIALCESGEIELVSSEVLELEMEKNTLAVRKEHIQAVLSKARSRIELNDEIEARASAW